MAEHINAKDSLNDGRKKLNESIDASERAESKSNQAIDIADKKGNQAIETADRAESKSDSTQTQLDTIVIEGDSSVEAAQARVDAEGIAHDTLKTRLDEEYIRVTSRLADMVTNVKNFGAIGDGIYDNTEAIIQASDFIQEKGGGTLYFPEGKYKFSAIKGDHIYEFENLLFFKMDGDGAKIIDNQTYDRENEEVSYLFKFKNSKNVQISNGIEYKSQTYDSDLNTAYSGIRWFEFLEGCSRITGNIRVEGGVSVLSCGRNSSKDSKEHITENIDVSIDASYVRYSYGSRFSGNNANVNLKTFKCGRSFFLYGVNNVKINLVEKDSGTSLIKSYDGLGCENIDVYFENVDSSRNNGVNAGEKLSIHFGDETPAVMKNIEIKLNTANYIGGWGHTLTIDKFVGGGSTPDDIGRGHEINGLKISGYSKGVSGVSHLSTNRGAFKYPDVIKNLSNEDLTLDESGSYSLLLNDSLEGAMSLKNVEMLHHNLIIRNQSGLVVYEKCTAISFSGNNTDESMHKYVDCNISSSNNQSVINKLFYNTMLEGVVRNRHSLNYLPLIEYVDAIGYVRHTQTSDSEEINIKLQNGVDMLLGSIPTGSNSPQIYRLTISTFSGAGKAQYVADIMIQPDNEHKKIDFVATANVGSIIISGSNAFTPDKLSVSLDTNGNLNVLLKHQTPLFRHATILIKE